MSHPQDFPNAQLPSMLPLARSYAENQIEEELKQLFIDLFASMLAEDTFDVSVLGAAHLGSFDLVRRAVNADGLVLLQGDREEAATRYLYRAWKSGNTQGRGLHFLRTYLQLLFPNLCQVDQLWHDKSKPYPTGLMPPRPWFSWWLHQVGEPGLKLDGTWGLGRRVLNADASRGNRPVNTDHFYLTSRILITIDFTELEVRSTSGLAHIIRSITPARLVPLIRLLTHFTLDQSISVSGRVVIKKRSVVRYVNTLVIGDSEDVRWKLGLDGVVTDNKIKEYRIQSHTVLRISAGLGISLMMKSSMPHLGLDFSANPPRVDGSWTLGED